MMLIAARDWKTRVLIVVAGGLLPVGYQIFRMGYYGLLVPQTALAKDASGDKWGQGLIYLGQLQQPLCAVDPRAAADRAGRGPAGPAQQTVVVRPRRRSRNYTWLARRVHSPAAVVIFMLLSGLVQALYWIRQGGDFMHGRVLLTPVFCLLTPVR